MRNRLKVLIQGVILFSVVGFIIYVSVNKIYPSQVKGAIKQTVNDYVKEKDKLEEKGIYTGFEKTTQALKDTGIVDYDKKDKVIENENITTDEVVYIDGELFERVANRKANELYKQADILDKYIEKACATTTDNISKSARKDIVNYSKKLSEGISDLLSMEYPSRDKTERDTMTLYANRFDKCLKNVVENEGKISPEDYQELLAKLGSFKKVAKNFLSAYALVK